MIDKDNLVRIKWIGGGHLFVETNSNDKRLYMDKKELLALLEVATRFVEDYKEDFAEPQLSYKEDIDGL